MSSAKIKATQCHLEYPVCTHYNNTVEPVARFLNINYCQNQNLREATQGTQRHCRWINLLICKAFQPLHLCGLCTVLDADRTEKKDLFPSSRGTDLCLKETILRLIISIKDEVKPSDRIDLTEELGMLQAYKVEKNSKY